VSAPRFPQAAVVLGGEVNGVAVIRSLGRLGVRCGLVHDNSRPNHAGRSKYLLASRVISADADDPAVAAAIREVAGRIGGDATVVIPTTDRYSQFLSRRRDALGPHFLVCNPDGALCDAFLDKWQTALLCRRHDILIPATECPQSGEELGIVAAHMTYPVIVKPRYTFATGFPGKNAVLESADALRQFLADPKLLGHCIVQEIIRSGDGDILVTASYSNMRGRTLAIYSGRKLRQYLPDYGATCFGISERHAALEETTRRFLDGIGYTGFAALEFARSRDDGRLYFIELNTRTYYHNRLFADAGVDLTQVGFLDAIGYDGAYFPGPLAQRDGLIWLDFRRDFMSMRIKRRQGRITLRGWFLSILKARSFANWDWRDPAPFVSACLWRARQLSLGLLRLLRRDGSRPKSSKSLAA
jgi:predicted ATP-grasp superfamily ATP-dependent carboligase